MHLNEIIEYSSSEEDDISESESESENKTLGSGFSGTSNVNEDSSFSMPSRGVMFVHDFMADAVGETPSQNNGYDCEDSNALDQSKK